MTTVNGHTRPQVMVTTGGHAFDEGPFFQVFQDNHEIDWAHAPVPSMRSWFSTENAGRWDAIVCYDMQGITSRRTTNQPPEFYAPPPEYVEGLTGLLEAGQGFVLLHHSITAWPEWPLWSEIVGGRWSYMPMELRGTSYPSSGYTDEIEHRVTVLDRDHPVCAGLGDGFHIVDELYLNPVFDDSFVPLLKSEFPMTPDHFFSGENAINGQLFSREGWTHPDGLGLIGWVKTAGNSPIVYLQCGHAAAAYGNPAFRTLVSNAINWVSSPAAHEWARANATALATA
jgi:type 1 glutamine amidotransferase